MVTAALGKSIRFRGEIYGDDDYVVDGSVEGKLIFPNNLLIVTLEGDIQGEIDAREITIKGQVKGDINAKQKVVVCRSAKVYGNINAPSVILKEGSFFHGSINEGTAANKKVLPLSKASPKTYGELETV